MPTLSAAAGSFAIVGGAVGAGLALAGAFVLSGGEASFTRGYTVDLGVVANLRLDRLHGGTAYFDKDGRPTAQMQQFWQRHCEAIERSFGSLASAVNAIQAAYDAASQASAAASEAKAAAVVATETVATVQTFVDDVQSGDFNFDAVMIGGKKFVNNDGALEPYEQLT